MKSVLVVLGAVLLAGPGQETATSPQGCVKAGREFAARKQKEASPLTGDIYRAIEAQRIEMVRACGAQFDPDKASAADLGALVDLYVETQQPELAQKAVTRGLVMDAQPRERADLLAAAVRMLLRQPKSDARNAKAEGYVDALESLAGDTFEQKLAAHAAMNSYYRGDDIDAGIIRHSTWIIDHRAQLSADQKKKYGNYLIAAYVNLAEALAGQGQNDRAVDLLKRAPAELADIPEVESRTKDTLARYLLVGAPTKPIESHDWLNRESTTPLDLAGNVTLLQFTAHWCGPCKESYPGMQRLRQRFKDAPFQVVFYTRTYGYFESERNLTREQEIERDRAYFKGYGFDIPIAVGPPSSTIVDGRPMYLEDPVEKAFGVSGIPQINVIDRKGRMRLIMIGYDDANEEKLATFIQQMLNEK